MDANAAFWVQIIRENRDRYRNELTNAAVLNAIGPLDQLAVLDAGCGEGYLARLLASDGATVTGVDCSANLTEAVRRQQLLDGLPVSYDVGSVDALPYEDNQFDLVVCNHVLNDCAMHPWPSANSAGYCTAADDWSSSCCTRAC